MGTILNNASVKQPLRNLLFICAGFNAFNAVLVLFVFKSLNFVMTLQQFVWLTLGSAVVLYVLNRSSARDSCLLGNVCNSFSSIRIRNFGSHCFILAKLVLYGSRGAGLRFSSPSVIAGTGCFRVLVWFS